MLRKYSTHRRRAAASRDRGFQHVPTPLLSRLMPDFLADPVGSDSQPRPALQQGNAISKCSPASVFYTTLGICYVYQSYWGSLIDSAGPPLDDNEPAGLMTIIGISV